MLLSKHIQSHRSKKYLDLQDDGKLKIKEVKSTPDNEKIAEVIWTRKLAQVGNIKIK